ncbi:hypothetical protein N3K66_007382 [Trichothecium roseum]|uniref:Uncharacterized protein n=1 Tax=Trichothecium roseum TaxID=47278 RepID=A0ACC0UV31_9HYPO|nr:hypothetical protein N3K66_007382 [Trichothecium roseum]
MAKKSSFPRTSSKAIDPTLDALFSGSAGPVQAPPKSRYSAATEQKRHEESADAEDDEGDDEVLSEASQELEYEDDEEMKDDAGADSNEKEDADEVEASEETLEEDSDVKAEAVAKEVSETTRTKRERKRKRKDDNDDLEERYLSKLAEEEEDDNKPSKRQRGDEAEQDGGKKEESEDEEPPKHESLTQESEKSEMEKANRTVFLANVSTEAINSKSAKKTLLKHLGSALEEGEKVESIRFRSVAFATGSMPKRAAYITGQLMNATTKSANAYAVYSTPAAARKAAAELNGTEVLERHIRVDSVAHPTPTDHKRCVFVGNLGFVDDETTLTTGEGGETVEKKRNKVPSDIEEGLWRTFSRQGRVENVRVIRDSKTRVGKGFAYVQFYDANTVESALLLNEKKFPPMLPRALRVTRAKDPRKTALHQERVRAKLGGAGAPSAKPGKYRRKFTAEEQTNAGRAAKLLGRSAAFTGRAGAGAGARAAPTPGGPGMKTPEQIVFEGKRVSSKDGRPRDLKFGKKAAKGGKPKNRGTKRAAEWRKKDKA